MGHGLSMPEHPMPVAMLALTMPALATEFMRFLERIGLDFFSHDAAMFGNMLKCYGLPLFFAGHYLQCINKPKLELFDWSYLVADVFHVWSAIGAYRKKPIPGAFLLAGLLWSGAFLPMRWRLLAAKQPPLVPTLGNGAGVTMALMGTIQLIVKYGLIKQALNGPMTMQQAGTLSGAQFFICTYVRLFQMIQQGKVQDNMFIGQCLKSLATTMCSIGNVMGHGWHRVELSRRGVLWLL